MKLAAPCSFCLRDTHIPALTHDKNKEPAKQRQNQSKVQNMGHCMSLMGHCHLSPCLLPGGAMWSHRLRSNAAFEIRTSPSLSLGKHLEEWKILQQNLGAVKQMQKYFSLLVFWLAFRILELVGTFHSLLPDSVSVSKKC